MSQDNMFDGFDWQPSGNYGKVDNTAVTEAKRTFSRCSLAIFAFLIVGNISVLLISILMLLSMGAEKYSLFLESNPIIEMLLSTLPMYIFAFPVLFSIVKLLPTRKREKRKLPALELFYTFLVAEAFMMAGNLLGQTLSTSIGSIFRIEVTNGTAELIMRTPIWLIFILVVIIAPIIEEFIFRKLMIDRLSRFGDTTAIIASALAFGLFHGNFYQFFYAAFLGLLLGYVYCKSGNIKYTIVYHMIINFLGSVVVIPLMKYEEILLSGAIPETGEAFREFIIASMMLGSYSLLQNAMVVSGVIIFIYALRNKKFFVNPTAELRIPEGKKASATLGNVGTILFLAFSLLSFGASIFLG